MNLKAVRNNRAAFSFWMEPKRLRRGTLMAFSTIVIVALIVALIGAVPTWRYSRAWGYGPFSVVAVSLVVVLTLVLVGRM
jgi:lipoprotein signal peptidase